jgi:hypothetical protein
VGSTIWSTDDDDASFLLVNLYQSFTYACPFLVSRSILQKCFGAFLLGSGQFGILRMSLGQGKAIHSLRKTNHQILRRNIGRRMTRHGLELLLFMLTWNIWKKRRMGEDVRAAVRIEAIGGITTGCALTSVHTLMTASAISFRTAAVRHVLGSQVM